MTNAAVPKNHFDRGKPFYPLVMHYMIQLIGFKDLAIRGIVGPANAPSIDSLIADAFDATVVGNHQDEIADINNKLRKLIGPLQLRTDQDDDHIVVDIENIAKDVSANASYLASFVMQSASAVLILAHELCKDQPYHDTGPLWEFLRHCRNAAAHGGRFDFRHDEPRRAAIWGRFELDRSLQGTRLFRSREQNGLISPGDVIRLLWDIEQAYPNM